MTLAVRELVVPLSEFTLDVTATFANGTTALYGPSGAGKTTLLECIAGLRKPQSGSIERNGVAIDDIPPRLRRIGYVPQDDALFPHLSVRRNVFYGGDADAEELIAALEIAPLLDRNVQQLSGGERKRIALARALVTKPELLLLDEPLSGVDVALRDRVLDYLLRVREKLPVPAIYVTHHLDEVHAICDAMVVLERGRVLETRDL